MADLTQDALFDLAGDVLGGSRAARSLELARLAPLTRRWVVTWAIASLIIGTRALGLDWWSRHHEDLGADGTWLDRGTPDALLTAGHAPGPGKEDGRSCLALLGNWIADDAADSLWGRPIDFVDLNDYRGDDRVRLPPGAKPGDRFVASWDPGGRVLVDIVYRDGAADPEAEKKGLRRGPVGSTLGKAEYHDAYEAGWAWSVATHTGPIRLPGEPVRGPGDPFAVPIDPGVAARLHKWAIDHGAAADELGGMWRTKGDVVAMIRSGLTSKRPGSWLHFTRAVEAVVDEDPIALAAALDGSTAREGGLLSQLPPAVRRRLSMSSGWS